MNLTSILPKGYAASTYTTADKGGSSGTEFKAIPPGLYTAEITGAEVRILKSGNGSGLTLEFTIIEPVQHANRKVWQNLNIQHTSEKAQEIGLRDLGNLFRAIGVETATENDLFGKNLKIRTRLSMGNDKYPPQAEVFGYEPVGGKPSVPPAQSRTAPPAGMKPPASWPQNKPDTAFDDMYSDVPF